MTPFEAVRAREYPGLDGIFFNAASWGLLPRRTVDAVAELGARRNRWEGFDEAELVGTLARARTAAARLIGATAAEIALAPNTSFGVNLAAACVGQGPPGTILVSAGEFPANVYPWLPLEARGFRVDILPTGPDALPDEERLCTALERADVRGLAVSQVQFATGSRADLGRLGALCRARGILFAVDAIQGLGGAPLDVRAAGIDVLACGGQKWLCSPWGSGFAFVDRALLERFDPPMVSWLAMRSAADFTSLGGYAWEPLEDARRFELATLGIQDHLGLAVSIELILELGPERIHEHLMGVHAPLLEWAESRRDVVMVTPRDPERRAGIVSFRTPDPERTAAALGRARVICAVREGAVRLAPHFYNTADEMRAVVEVLDRSD
ncbi:MAG: aminotransferase class V-fold PLP-dependent enzyme [Gemmatimonadetes bacterium]|nr:aminotransferase class V-fold PLP-dependent enzyme [Gemmatimonadota bacterium]